MNLTVSRDPEGKTGLIELPADQVWFVESYKKVKDMIALHVSQTECFYAPGTLKFWSTALKASGLPFVIVDRTNAIHLPKIKSFDEYLRAFFTDNRTKDSKYCTVSLSNANMVREYLQKNMRFQ